MSGFSLLYKKKKKTKVITMQVIHNETMRIHNFRIKTI